MGEEYYEILKYGQRSGRSRNGKESNRVASACPDIRGQFSVHGTSRLGFVGLQRIASESFVFIFLTFTLAWPEHQARNRTCGTCRERNLSRHQCLARRVEGDQMGGAILDSGAWGTVN